MAFHRIVSDGKPCISCTRIAINYMENIMHHSQQVTQREADCMTWTGAMPLEITTLILIE